MSAIVVQLDDYRQRAPRPPGRRRRPQTRRRRPTVAQALLEYGNDADLFGDLVVTKGKTGRWGGVAHRTTYSRPDLTWVLTPCGHGGPARDAKPTDLLCLRCFPWWQKETTT